MREVLARVAHRHAVLAGVAAHPPVGRDGARLRGALRDQVVDAHLVEPGQRVGAPVGARRCRPGATRRGRASAQQPLRLGGVDEAAEEVGDLAVDVPRRVVLQASGVGLEQEAGRAGRGDLLVDRRVVARQPRAPSASAPRRRARRTRRPRRRTSAPRAAARPHATFRAAAARDRHDARRPPAGRPRRPDAEQRDAAVAVVEERRRRGRGACRRGRGTGSARAAHAARRLPWAAMAVTRRTEPWSALLDAGRPTSASCARRSRAPASRTSSRPARRPAPRPARGAARARGSTRCSATRPTALEAAWARPDDRHDGHRVGQVAVLQPPDARRPARRRQGARALPLPDQGAGPGPGARAARARPPQAAPPGDLRRRHADARSAPAIRRRSEPRPDEPRHAPRRDPAQPRRAGATSSRTSRSSSSTRRTSTAASSAPTSRTSCDGCGAIAGAYGTEPRFLLASATIANPVELAERLTGLDDVPLVDRDGSPGARRQIAMWNPPVVDEALQTRRSALAEAAEIVAEPRARGARGRSAS